MFVGGCRASRACFSQWYELFSRTPRPPSPTLRLEPSRCRVVHPYFASLVSHLEMCWCAPLHTLDPPPSSYVVVLQMLEIHRLTSIHVSCHSKRGGFPPSWLSRQVFKQCRGRYPVDPFRWPSRRSMFARYRWSGLVRPPPSAVAFVK
jgi:hypothetical protein